LCCVVLCVLNKLMSFYVCVYRLSFKIYFSAPSEVLKVNILYLNR